VWIVVLALLILACSDMCGAVGRLRVVLSAGGMECLERYGWPGSVRKLGNLIDRMSILCGGRPVGAADLPPRYRPAGWTPSADHERVVEVLPVVHAVAPAPVAFPDAEVTAEREHATRLSEREVLLMLEDAAVANGTVLPPGGIDL